uniref:B box-type domain-containing protein n=1 Tax=Caenorhabditis tropicalis TaxID=1561998 RepID=A0A1I7U5Z4_9PELO
MMSTTTTGPPPSSMEMEGGVTSTQQQQSSEVGGGGARLRHHTDLIDVDANDSGNELSMGGSSSEGDSMSHHRGEHSPNHHQDSVLLLNGGSQNTVFQPFTGSLFDTPPSLLSSPHQQFNGSFSSPTAFGGLGGLNDSFRCAVCSKIGRNALSGVLQFVCAHKTCQTCFQTILPTNRHSCTLCGAGPATAANFPPQMFLSPTLPSTPHGNPLIDASTPAKPSTPQQAPRAFSFSLSGLPGSPVMPRMSTPVSAGGLMMRSMAGGGYSDTESAWSSVQQVATPQFHHQPPPQLTIKNLPTLGQTSPMMSNVFESLSANDDTPVFSPLSPTNTSSHMPPSLMASSEAPRHSATIAPPRTSLCSTPRLPSMSSSSSTITPIASQYPQTFQIPPPLAPPTGQGASQLQQFQQQTMAPIQCQGCESNVSLAYCMQCQEALCAHCVQAHQRVRATKQHAFVELQQLMATLVRFPKRDEKPVF